jgi:two-component system chemotaxis response regulator CheY
MRILLVDDSASTRAMLRQMLSALGHKDIVEAADGIDAAKTLQQESPDLVICDWRVRHVDGNALLKTLRTNGNNVPVLIVITRTERCQAICALQAGANSYIVKPFDQNTLADRIRQAITNAAPPK